LPETRAKLSEAIKKHPTKYWADHPYPEGAKLKLSRYWKERLSDPNVAIKHVKHLFDIKRPTSIELQLLDIIKRNNLPYRYVGNGAVFLGNPPMNPDFIHRFENIVIEVFGSYWHDKQDEVERKEAWNKLGFNCIVIWDTDLVDEQLVLKKITSGREMKRMMATRTLTLPIIGGGR
jgi:G:T-mismatch repair DNA endonuclease (very short patch repair protein)